MPLAGVNCNGKASLGSRGGGAGALGVRSWTSSKRVCWSWLWSVEVSAGVMVEVSERMVVCADRSEALRALVGACPWSTEEGRWPGIWGGDSRREPPICRGGVNTP